jgi:hypothetical protein
MIDQHTWMEQTGRARTEDDLFGSNRVTPRSLFASLGNVLGMQIGQAGS